MFCSGSCVYTGLILESFKRRLQLKWRMWFANWTKMHVGQEAAWQRSDRSSVALGKKAAILDLLWGDSKHQNQISSRLFPPAKAAQLSLRSSPVAGRDVRYKQLLRCFGLLSVYWTGSLFWFRVVLITRTSVEVTKNWGLASESGQSCSGRKHWDNTGCRNESVLQLLLRGGEVSVEMRVTAASKEIWPSEYVYLML